MRIALLAFATMLVNAAIVVGIGYFIWKLVAMATGH